MSEGSGTSSSPSWRLSPCSGCVYFQQHNQVAGKQSQLTGLQAQAAVLDASATKLQPYAQIEQMRSSLTQTTQSIYDARVSWSTIFEEISLVIPDNVRLTALNCTVPPTMLPGSTAAATAPGATATAPPTSPSPAKRTPQTTSPRS